MHKKNILNYSMLISCFSSFFINPVTYANTPNRNIDIYGNLGYTSLSGFTFDKTNKLFNDFSGVNLGISALYSFTENAYFNPVIGGSLGVTGVTNSNKSPDISEVSSIDTSFIYTTVAANAGVKFYLSNSIKLYALANLGYSPNSKFDADFNSSNSFVNVANYKTEYEIRNHYYYGATLMGTYMLGESFSLGGAFTYNRHNMALDYKPQPVTITETSAFNEYSANIIAMWSI